MKHRWTDETVLMKVYLLYFLRRYATFKLAPLFSYSQKIMDFLCWAILTLIQWMCIACLVCIRHCAVLPNKNKCWTQADTK